MERQLHEHLQQLLEPAAAAVGCELLGIEFQIQGHRPVLRLFIDRDEGITLEDCERVSHQASGVLDVEDPIRSHYALEVSSPGLDRPLFKEAHFARFTGQLARVKLLKAIAGRRNFTGRLRGVHDGKVRMEVEEEIVEFEVDQIDKARLVPEL
ncbi:MAG: ribosome maturation factor RimP [Gammaproteobacteria bacterium]|nr:ribosome maturation factor RimP [Gammaproteobacteria bacterium]